MKNTIDEAIEILQAIKAGKEIQYKNRHRPDRWKDLNTYGSRIIPTFNSFIYRIKPVCCAPASCCCNCS